MDLIVLATEGGIPTSNPWSQLALPLGILIFVGSVYLLLRSNLGTRRGYLVMSTSLWGFTFLLSLLWAFGAPGTPPNTGPQNLPGQELDEYIPVWVPFAQDSLVVTEEGSPYSAVVDYPDGWGEVPEDFAGTVETGASNITSFFSGLEDAGEEPGTYRNVLFGTEAIVDTQYAEADNGRPMIAVTTAATCQLEDMAEEGEEPDFALPAACEDAGLDVGDPLPADAEGASELTLFAFYDAGSPYFPSLLMAGVLLILFALHMALLWRDESRESREAAAVADEDVVVEERATVSV